MVLAVVYVYTCSRIKIYEKLQRLPVGVYRPACGSTWTPGAIATLAPSGISGGALRATATTAPKGIYGGTPGTTETTVPTGISGGTPGTTATTAPIGISGGTPGTTATTAPTVPTAPIGLGARPQPITLTLT